MPIKKKPAANSAVPPPSDGASAAGLSEASGPQSEAGGKHPWPKREAPLAEAGFKPKHHLWGLTPVLGDDSRDAWVCLLVHT